MSGSSAAHSQFLIRKREALEQSLRELQSLLVKFEYEVIDARKIMHVVANDIGVWVLTTRRRRENGNNGRNGRNGARRRKTD